jgi:4-amino-4-deoxy-L-arabinose transferase-like glycosyltransferase
MDSTSPRTSTKILLALLFLAWMLPGLVGRDPWKADEPYTFGIVYHMLQTGEWLVPNVAGVPFLEKPPIYFISATAAARLFSPLFELHDAIRFVNIAWLFLTMLFLALAARELAGSKAAWNAPVLLMGCVILQVTAHKMVTDIALICGLSMGLYGLAASRRSPGWGGFWAGTGAGVGFLAKGLLAPGILGVVALGLPVLFAEWRSRSYGRALVVGAAASLPWVVIWPAMLYAQSREYFLEIFWYQNFGRFVGFARIMKPDTRWYYLINLPWHGLPVLPLAAWALWMRRAEWRVSPLFQLPLLTYAVTLAVLSMSASNRDLYALPTILPLTIIAAAAGDDLSERARNLMTRSSVVLFGVLGIVLWGALIAHLSGNAALASVLPANTLHYGPRDPRLIAAAAVLTVFWLFVVLRTMREEGPLLLAWTAGMVLVWGLAMTLWLPWLEASASYRGIFSSLRESLPADHRCVASFGMGESERAMIEHYAGIQVRPIDYGGEASCDLLLVALERRHIDTSSLPAWTVIWVGQRPQDRPKEHYTLFRTASPKDRQLPALSAGMIRLKGN